MWCFLGRITWYTNNMRCTYCYRWNGIVSLSSSVLWWEMREMSEDCWDAVKETFCVFNTQVQRKKEMKCSLSNAYTQWTVTSGVTRGWMARGSHSFTCHPHVYPRMEWAILHSFRKHSPDGVAWAGIRGALSTRSPVVDNGEWGQASG